MFQAAVVGEQERKCKKEVFENSVTGKDINQTWKLLSHVQVGRAMDNSILTAISVLSSSYDYINPLSFPQYGLHHVLFCNFLLSISLHFFILSLLIETRPQFQFNFSLTAPHTKSTLSWHSILKMVVMMLVLATSVAHAALISPCRFTSFFNKK